ncbi:MAG: N-acetylmuramoyl-L-alanine amidase [Hyphomicrobiales bacterium]|nr:N-acetylmuramoyl-L-alanine amidase [Hyphomicrobiales bacterium]
MSPAWLVVDGHRAMQTRMHNLRHLAKPLAKLLVCLCLLSIAGAVVSTPQAGEVKTATVASAARLGGDNARTRFVAELNTAIGYNVYVIPDPFRVIIDLPEVEFRIPDANRGRGLISGYRFGRIDQDRSRIVLDATGPVLIDRSFVLRARNGKPARIVVDIIRTDRMAFDELHRKEQPQPPPAPVSAMAAISDEDSAKSAPVAVIEPVEPGAGQPVVPDTATAPPPPQPLADEAQDAPASAIAALPVERPVPLPRPRPGTAVASASQPAADHQPVKPRNAKRIIVLDPGHGGIDSGAVSRSRKTKEKDIVLKFAHQLKGLLVAAGRYEVILTRDDDQFLPLRDRVKIARDADADMFIAIHADSIHGRSARGATVYTVSDQASDEEAAELASKENRADIIAGVDLASESDEVAGILIDLAQRETKNYSISMAKKMVRHMKPVTKLNRRPLRSADFRVLKAPDVPSVLVELGYLSSRSDERLLVSGRWRKKVAGALTKAIDGYFATRLASGN